MADNITFMEIPVGIRAGGVFVEIDHTQAVRGLPVMERKLLLIGSRLAAGAVPALTPVRALSGSLAREQFGAGSQLARMAAAVDKVKARYGLLDVWAIALDDTEGGSAATGTLTVTGSPSAAGQITLWLGQDRLRIAAATGDTATVLASRIAAAINAATDLPVTASSAAGVVTIAARNKGEAGNGISLATQYYDEDTLPPGVSVAIAPMAGGTGNPDVGAALAVVSDDWFYSVATAYSDSANMATLESDMAGRFGPMRDITGHVFAAIDGTHGALTTYANTHNSPHSTVWGLKGCPTWAPERAAAFAATCEYHGAIDPALPLRNVTVPGVLAPRLADRFSFNERELLLRDGVSTTKVDKGGNVLLERVITTYQQNVQGMEDQSLLRLETKWTADYYRYAVKSRIALRFPRHKLVSDGTNIAPGQKVVSPALIRAELIALHRELEYAGIVEGTDQFKADLLVERSASDPDRVNAVLPPDLVNQFVTFAAAVQFRL